MAHYAIEFGALGDTRPVPDLTVQTTDLNVLDKAVVEHARPHITPVLTELGRPELADCLFRMNKDRTMGQFLHLNLATGMAAEFLPARITTTPERIQRKRTKGWTKGAAVIVTRPSRLGNPFTLDMAYELGYAAHGDTETARRSATGAFQDWLRGNRLMWQSEEGDIARQRILDALPELRGKDIACYCPLPEPGQPDHCHGAVLLELANTPEEN